MLFLVLGWKCVRSGRAGWSWVGFLYVVLLGRFLYCGDWAKTRGEAIVLLYVVSSFPRPRHRPPKNRFYYCWNSFLYVCVQFMKPWDLRRNIRVPRGDRYSPFWGSSSVRRVGTASRLERSRRSGCQVFFFCVGPEGARLVSPIWEGRGLGCFLRHGHRHVGKKVVPDCVLGNSVAFIYVGLFLVGMS